MFNCDVFERSEKTITLFQLGSPFMVPKKVNRRLDFCKVWKFQMKNIK